MAIFDVYLIKPTRYDDEGYPLQWWRSIVPSNSLACMYGIACDAVTRGLPAPGVVVELHTMDEINSNVPMNTIIKRSRENGRRSFVCLVGVQSNQFPRAIDVARPLRAAGIPVCIGGFHVSGCLSMLKDMPPDLVEAQGMGISFFAGEAEEGRFDEVLTDAWNGTLKPLYNHVKNTPSIAGAPLPFMPESELKKNFNRYSSFDLGRGCPFECTFCTIINVQGRKSRFRTPDDLEAIVRDNARHGVNRFFLTDDNFARNKAWRSFTDRLLKLQLEGFPVRLAIQVDTLTHRIEGFIDECVAVGADQIFIGLENINARNLDVVKKRQNRIEEYREMFLAWKKYPVVITCGYIVGFPADTRESILADIDILKRELPIDTLYLNYLTPLPGSADHKTLYESGVWMDPDMSKYDLTHRVTHHPVMTDAEWDDAYRRAHQAFYSWAHMEVIIRRLVALKSNKRHTTINRLLLFREAVRCEGVSALEGGYLRMRSRRQRRTGMALENPVVFYPKQLMRSLNTVGHLIYTYGRLRYMLRRVMRDARSIDYMDNAIAPVDAVADDVLMKAAMESAGTRRRLAARAPLAQTDEMVQAAQ